MATAVPGAGQTRSSAEPQAARINDTPVSGDQHGSGWHAAAQDAYHPGTRLARRDASSTATAHLNIGFQISGEAHQHPSYQTDQTITVDGGNRQGTARLMLPDNYDPAKKYPLVVALHGYQGNANDISTMMDLDRLRKAGNIVLVPSAQDHSWNGSGISFFGDAKGTNGQPINDVGFVESAIGQVESKYNVNRNDITVAGFSQGGQLGYQLSADMDDNPSREGRVRTLVSAAGSDPDARHGQTLDPLRGTNIVEYEPGKNMMQNLGNVLTGDPSVSGFLPRLIAAKGGLPDPTHSSDIGGVQITSFIETADNTRITHIYEQQGEHAWPGQPKSYDSSLMGRGSISHVELTDWVLNATNANRNR